MSTIYTKLLIHIIIYHILEYNDLVGWVYIVIVYI